MRAGFPGYDADGCDASDIVIDEMQSMYYKARRIAPVLVEDLQDVPPGARRVYDGALQNAPMQRATLDCLFRCGAVTPMELARLLRANREMLELALQRLRDQGAVVCENAAGILLWRLI